MQQMYSRVVDLTPELAKKLLANQTRNRPVIKARVAQYVRKMRSGLWRLTCEAIAIADNGRMINGQHRCLAVIESGVTIKVTVTFNCDESTFAVMDQGANRSAEGLLALEGYENSKRYAAVARQCLLFEQGRIGSNEPVDNSEILEFVEQHQMDLEKTIKITSHVRHYPALIGAVHYIFATQPFSWARDRADSFVETFKTGLNINSVYHPVAQLKKRLDERRVGVSYAHRDVLAWTFRCFNAYFNDELVKRFPLSDESQDRYKVNVKTPRVAVAVVI